MAGSNLLAPSTFLTTPSQTTAAVDIYKKSNSSIVNSIQDFAKKYDVDLSAVIRGGQYVGSLLPIVTGVLNGRVQVNSTNLASRIIGLSSNISSAYRSLPDKTRNLLTNDYVDMDKAFATIQGVTSKLRYTNFDDVSSIARFINGISSDKNVITIDDQDSYVGLFTSVIREATAYGIPNSFSAVVSTIQSGSVLNRVLGQVIPDTLRYSDVRTLEAMLTSSSSHYVRLSYPNLTRQFSSVYVQGFGYDSTQTVDEFTAIVNAFDKYNPTWNKKIRYLDNGTTEEIFDLTTITKSSPAFNEGLLSTIRTKAGVVDPVLALSTVFKSTDVLTEIKRAFPLSVLTSDSNNASTYQPFTVLA